MKRLQWERSRVINSLRKDVWRHLTQAAYRERELTLEASALLRMPPGAVRAIARVQFVLSDEVRSLIDEMPLLIRRLATTTTREEEWSVDRIRGPISWGATLGSRATTGLRHGYVTAPARRAFHTPENQVLIAALDAIHATGQRTGWEHSTSEEVGLEVRERVREAERWLATRMLEIERRPIGPHTVARVRNGRHRRRYECALNAFRLYERYLRRIDRAAIQQAVEEHALVAAADSVLLELLCAFRIEDALRRAGWKLDRPGLIRGGVLLQGARQRDALTVYYQSTPSALARESLYAAVQESHTFASIGRLRPDFVIEFSRDGTPSWVLVEVKGVQRHVVDSARTATLDLLAYRCAFHPALASQVTPYGLGIAWGEGLEPAAHGEIRLCTPDKIEGALGCVLPPPR